MRIIPTLAALPLLAMLAACGSTDGYYDANGNWVAPANATTHAQRTHSPSPGHREHHPRERGYDERAVTYDRAGYYDYNGYYVSAPERMSVPQEMFPPRGMCRVWLPERMPQYQPRVESCEGIHSRVPAGAYVIYGG